MRRSCVHWSDSALYSSAESKHLSPSNPPTTYTHPTRERNEAMRHRQRALFSFSTKGSTSAPQLQKSIGKHQVGRKQGADSDERFEFAGPRALVFTSHGICARVTAPVEHRCHLGPLVGCWTVAFRAAHAPPPVITPDCVDIIIQDCRAHVTSLQTKLCRFTRTLISVKEALPGAGDVTIITKALLEGIKFWHLSSNVLFHTQKQFVERKKQRTI